MSVTQKTKKKGCMEFCVYGEDGIKIVPTLYYYYFKWRIRKVKSKSVVCEWYVKSRDWFDEKNKYVLNGIPMGNSKLLHILYAYCISTVTLYIYIRRLNINIIRYEFKYSLEIRIHSNIGWVWIAWTFY